MEMAIPNGVYKMIDGPPHNRKRSSMLLCVCDTFEFLISDTENKEALMDSLGMYLPALRQTQGQ